MKFIDYVRKNAAIIIASVVFIAMLVAIVYTVADVDGTFTENGTVCYVTEDKVTVKMNDGLTYSLHTADEKEFQIGEHVSCYFRFGRLKEVTSNVEKEH